MNLSMDSSTKAGDKEGDEHDEQLLWTKDILTRLHERYYSQDLDNGPLKTVPGILSEMRREVLSRDKIVLSGLVPLHRQNELSEKDRPRPDFIRYAESMGATVSSPMLLTCVLGPTYTSNAPFTQVLPTVQPDSKFQSQPTH